MKPRLLNLLDDFRESFWFAPAIIGTGAMVLAFAVLQVDHRLVASGRNAAWFVHDAAAARQLLSSISSIVITLTGIVFSITLVAISMASSQFGSRLLRCFMTDSFADRLVGMLLATALYCYIVLNHVVEGSGDIATFVPQFATALAAAGGFVSVSGLIWFVHDTALSLQAPRLIAAVAADLDEAVDRLFPPANEENDSRQPSAPARDDEPDGESELDVRADDDGYVEAVDYDAIKKLAIAHDLDVDLKARTGHFVTRETVIACVRPGHSDETLRAMDDDDRQELAQSISGSLIVGRRRTPRQDITCSIIELVEVAIRALSPGINNTYAAMNCIDRLSASLARLATRPFPDAKHYDDDGHLRLRTQPITFPDLLKDAFAQIRQFGSGSVSITIRLLEGLRHIAVVSGRAEHLRAIRQHAQSVRTTFLASHPSDLDVADFERRWQQLESINGWPTEEEE